MPELPEVEIVRRGLETAMAGARIRKVEQRRPDLRFPLPERFAMRLEGRRIDSIGRRAKYLLGNLDDGMVLVMHLGMTGSFRIGVGDGTATQGAAGGDNGKDAAHDHILFHLASGATVTYNDPRRFGFMTLVARA
ncbi:MAG: DNA-formamidopyrimidine glycosylase, partial [Methylobacteriaceae bacterium]|nr:DNA-formamidopyrimidine glycosylase [Methylobacteriaceae bacterium]